MDNTYYKQSTEYRKFAIREEVLESVSRAKQEIDKKNDEVWEIWNNLCKSVIFKNGD